MQGLWQSQTNLQSLVKAYRVRLTGKDNHPQYDNFHLHLGYLFFLLQLLVTCIFNQSHLFLGINDYI